MGADAGSFIGGFVLGAIAGAVFIGFKAITIGAQGLGKASEMGWLNQAEMKKDLAAMKRAQMARAYSTRSRRAYPARAIYGHGVGVESDLNRIPIYLG